MEFLGVFKDCVSLEWNACTQCLCHALRGGEVDPNIIALIVSVCYRMNAMVNGMVNQSINYTINYTINLPSSCHQQRTDDMVNDKNHDA